MISIFIRMPSICKYPECQKYASYGPADTNNRIYCKEHAEDGMVAERQDKRTCIHPDHSNGKYVRASFNFSDEKKPLYCKAHAQEGMINFNNRNNMCQACQKKQPSFGIEGQKATHCAKCADKNTMVDLISNLCTYQECRKNATYGIVGQKATRCKQHAEECMLDVKNSKCKLCHKQPTYGLGKKATHCFDHKTEQMNDVRHDT